MILPVKINDIRPSIHFPLREGRTGHGYILHFRSRKNPFSDIKSDGTVKTALENLGLGEGSAHQHRRFGKSLLVSTLEAYFSGKKDLFSKSSEVQTTTQFL